MFGAGGGTNSYREIEETEVILLWGSNARETHPIFFHHLLKGIHNGARLFAIDPRRTSSARWADAWLGLDVGSDIALANAVGREIIAAGLENREFIEHATTGFESYRQAVEPYTLAYAERETGVPARTIREMAHAYARADRAMICWTLGITEHHNAVDNVFALINLALLTGHVGRYGSGLNPLRGQNNVQGGGDMGALPDRLPGFQHVEVAEFRAKFERRWGVPVPPTRGWHMSEMFEAMERGEFRALYVLGENPLQSEADQAQTRHRLESLDLLIVQDIFLTATAADGRRGLPGRGRLVRIGRDGDQQRAPGSARAQGARSAGGSQGRPEHPLRSRAPDGTRLGRTECRENLGRSTRTQPAARGDELRPPGGRPAGSSGPAMTRTIRASCSCTAGSGSGP